MPNNFGGDQLDEDYAPHLYGERTNSDMSDSLKDMYERTVRDLLGPSVSKDPRVRAEVGDYRVVAPNGRPKDGRFFVNGSLVIEKKDKNALGEVRWSHVTTLVEPGVDCKDEGEIALYWLLSGPWAE
jgi:hypothetical protein